KAGALATAIAIVLGTLAAFALYRASFFGRTMVSFLFVLPIALPGIITGMALNSYFTYFGQTFGLWTIVVGHATFWIVIVFNNVVARLRRMPTSLTEASMDLGADGFQTFVHVTLPAISTALISGALLAFALSFDEVIVTTFTAGVENTLPIWIFGNIRLGQQLPEVNVVVYLLLLATIMPVVLAQRLTGESGILRTEGKDGGEPMATVTSNKIFVGGKWKDSAEGGTMEVLNPATGDTIAEVPACTAADVDAAVEAAAKALPEW